jgi:hypothetical protein
VAAASCGMIDLRSVLGLRTEEGFRPQSEF